MILVTPEAYYVIPVFSDTTVAINVATLPPKKEKNVERKKDANQTSIDK